MNIKEINYDFSLDVIRVIAIILVIILHILSSEQFTLNHNIWWISTTIQSISKVAVPLFIMLSGYLLLDKNRQYTSIISFYKKRILKIGIPLLFWPIFYYLGSILATGKQFTIFGFINDYIFLNIFYHLYFLFIIAGLYIVTPIIKPFLTQVKHHELKWITYALLIYSIIFLIIHYYAPTRFNYWMIFTVFIPFISYYIAGNYFRYYKITQKNFLVLSIIYLIILGFTVLIKFHITNQTFISNNNLLINYFSDAISINVVILSIISYILLLNINKIRVINTSKLFVKTIQKISESSFGIYLIHPIILFITSIILSKMLSEIYMPVGIILVFKFIFVFFVSYYLVKIIFKIPYINLILGSK